MNPIPYILASFTGPRVKNPRNEFMRDNWTNNLFRIKDAIFWRKAHPNGDVIIRPEVSASRTPNAHGVMVETRHFYTVEALLIHLEAQLRAFLANPFKKLGFKIVRVPVLALPTGETLSPIFSYAIAVDVHGETDGAAGSTDVTISLTLGGTATLLLGSVDVENAGADPVTGIVWNTTETLTQIVKVIGGGESAYIYGRLSPSTGLRNMVTSRSSCTCFTFAISYSGTDTSALPSITSSNSLTASSAGTISASLTTPVDNCWVSGCGGNDFANGMTSNKTVRDFNNGGSSRASFDTNAAITPAQGVTCTLSVGGTGNWAIVICAIQPPGSAAPAFSLWQFFGF